MTEVAAELRNKTPAVPEQAAPARYKQRLDTDAVLAAFTTHFPVVVMHR
jgi:hypothetical protein